MIIGICGGSGSGKTSILNGLKEHFKALKPSVLSLDNYYLPIEKQAIDERGVVNFDLPNALDRERLYNDLQKLVRGESVELVEYTFNHSKTETTIRIEPSDLLIVEGLFVMCYEEIYELLDYSIFVDVCEKIQLERRIERDLVARGYTKEEVLYQWNNHVLPCYENYVEPFKELASFVVLNEGPIELVIQQVIDKLNELPMIQVFDLSANNS
jgi:uridine kinase